jgi:hypothetical protein
MLINNKKSLKFSDKSGRLDFSGFLLNPKTKPKDADIVVSNADKVFCSQIKLIVPLHMDKK